MLSIEHAVHQNTPKTFLWHTAEDALVPVENTYLYAMALSRHKIEHEVHVYPHGEHGIGLGTIDYRRNAHATQWRNACEKWLFSQGF
ncbi:MAG: prolyl oligopeptidase family serine peptidase, partial [Lentisphaeraceae bacterium]|nr:prolyl oligopeptidase family serine peptidase [Lentisphaeraceae bacterium]